MTQPHANGRSSFRPLGIGIALLALVVSAALWWWRQTPETPAPVQPPPPAAVVRLPVEDRPVLDFNKLSEDTAMKAEMDERKATFGIDQELDMVVNAGESMRIGDQVVSMTEIQRQIALKEGRILESDAGSAGGKSNGEIYGIHVVQPGDNLWNIHFGLLKAYFHRKGARLSPLSDEPHANGTSSGVGRLLKFSENAVYIYNLNERRLESNIDSIYPNVKIVVYKMKSIFGLLDRIDVAALDQIRFDGDTLWLPARQ